MLRDFTEYPGAPNKFYKQIRLADVDGRLLVMHIEAEKLDQLIEALYSASGHERTFAYGAVRIFLSGKKG